MNGYAALAERRKNRTLLGEGEGFNWASIIPGIFSAAGQGTAMIVQSEQEKKRQKKEAADQASALAAALAADTRAKNALATSLLSAEAGASGKVYDEMAAKSALDEADEKAKVLSPESQKRRAEAAKSARDRAIAERRAVEGNKDAGVVKVKEAYVRAAQQVYAKTQNALIAQAAQLPGGVAEMQAVPAKPESWLTKKVLGPVPGWVVLAGSAVVATVAIAALARR